MLLRKPAYCLSMITDTRFSLNSAFEMQVRTEPGIFAFGGDADSFSELESC